MRELTVCYVAREDFVSKPGGDTVQWQLYRAAAEAAGLRCVNWFADGPMPKADVYHGVNVDRPLELYPRLREAHRQGRPFVLSTVHHPIPWLERFRQAEMPGGLLGQVLYRSPLGKSERASEAMKEVVRVVKQRRFGCIKSLLTPWPARIRWLLTHASLVLLLSPNEKRHLNSDFGVSLQDDRTAVLPNWVEGVGEGQGTGAEAGLLKQWPEPPVLVVSRIEARKNVRRLAMLAGKARRPVLFIGKPNPYEAAYVAAFTKAVSQSRCARWVPGVPRAELSSYYRIGSFLLNASYVEVSPMVDIEALSFGCPVATTQSALHHALLPNNTPVCDPYDDEDILRRLAWRPARQAPLNVIDPKACKKQLLRVYERLAS